MEEVSLGEKKSGSFHGCRVKSSFTLHVGALWYFCWWRGVTGGVTREDVVLRIELENSSLPAIVSL